jgi:glycosyltransferase involved in cell wall biosynthesis
MSTKRACRPDTCASDRADRYRIALGFRAVMRVLLLIPGRLGERMSAPEVRGLNMARELASRYDVTVAAPGSTLGAEDGITIIPLARRSVVRAARDAAVVIAPSVPPYLYAALAAEPTLLVADMYNPAELEQAAGDAGLQRRLTVATIRHGDALQLRFADVVLCAVEAQRRRLAAQIEALGARRTREPLLRVVPFGIDNEPPPRSMRRPLRERFPVIANDDTVILWWGNVWRWFDAETALRAFAQLAREDPSVKLVFTGGRPPRAEASTMDATASARELARSLGLLGRVVHFVDDWIPHAERHDYLQEADVGLTLHRETPEMEVAARGRYMDYLWARLPCVLGKGDELADQFAEQGFAATVTPGDVQGAVAALRRLTSSPEARASARAAAEPLVARFRWSGAVAPLLEALEEVAGRRPVRQHARRELWPALGRFYTRRIALQAVRTARARRAGGRSP